MIADTSQAFRATRERAPQHWMLSNGPWALSVLLGAAMTFAVVQSVALSNWAHGLTVITPVAIGGIMVAAVFARFRWLPGYLAHLLSAVLGLAWTVKMLGPLMDAGLTTWRDHALELLIHGIAASRLAAEGGVGDDLLLFVAVLALISWALGYASIWMLLRYGWAWWVVLLNAVMLFVNLTYASPKPPIGLFFLFDAAALLIIVQQTYLQRARSWDAAHMDYPDFLGWRFVASSVLVVLALLVGTTLLPTRITTTQAVHAWQLIREPWQIIQARWDRTFSNINAPANAAGGGFSSKAFSFAGARTLGTNLVMEVQSPRFEYWRATAYDRYDGRLSWSNTTGDQARATLGRSTIEESRTPLNANTRVPQLDTLDREIITQTVILHQNFPIATLFAATQPVEWSLPTLVEHTFLQANGATVANFGDTSLVQATDALRDGTSYTVESLVANADKASLRTAATEYPAWVQRYLQLPTTLPQRVRDKTQSVVAGAKAANPYDKAEAIESFLRTFPYDEQIPSPPDDRDVIDYFIFDLRRGYCDYFASAMVVMLRTQGIPARVAQGYAGGEFNAKTGRYDVRQNLAHSWPEVYFPGYGWQRFEPTPAGYAHSPQRAESSQSAADSAAALLNGHSKNDPEASALDRLEQQLTDQSIRAPITSDEAKAAQVRYQQEQAAKQRLIWEERGAAGGSLAVVLLAGLVFWRRPRNLGPAAKVYSRVLRWADWAGLGAKASTTPYEFAANLSRGLPTHRQTLEAVAGAFSREQYGATGPVSADAVNHSWRTLRWPLLLAVLRRFTHPPRIMIRRDRRP